MTIEAPPIQEVTTAPNGRFPLVWLRWFDKVFTEINIIDGGSP